MSNTTKLLSSREQLVYPPQVVTNDLVDFAYVHSFNARPYSSNHDLDAVNYKMLYGAMPGVGAPAGGGGYESGGRREGSQKRGEKPSNIG